MPRIIYKCGITIQGASHNRRLNNMTSCFGSSNTSLRWWILSRGMMRRKLSSTEGRVTVRFRLLYIERASAWRPGSGSSAMRKAG